MPKAKVAKVAKANNIPSELTIKDVELLPAWKEYTTNNMVNVTNLKQLLINMARIPDED